MEEGLTLGDFLAEVFFVAFLAEVFLVVVFFLVALGLVACVGGREKGECCVSV